MTDDDNTSAEDELSFLRRTFKDRTAVIQALNQDLGRQQRAIAPQVLFSKRLEHLVNLLFPPFPDGQVPDDQVPTNPARLHLELAWLDVLEPLYRQALREAIANPQPGLIIPQANGGRRP